MECLKELNEETLEIQCTSDEIKDNNLYNTRKKAHLMGMPKEKFSWFERDWDAT